MDNEIKGVPIALALFQNLPKGIDAYVEIEDEMHVLKFKFGNLVATVGCGGSTERGIYKLWATVYSLQDITGGPVEYPEAKTLLVALRDYYKRHNYDFAYSSAENTAVKSILYKNQIKERDPGTLRV